MVDKQTIRDFLIELANKDVEIGDDDSLLVTKFLDSLKIAELILFIEDTFYIEFDEDELSPENLDSINAITDFLLRKGVE